MKNSLSHSKVDRWRWSLAALVLAVQACGGGGDGGTGSPDTAFSNGAPTAAVPPPPAPAPQPAPVPVAVAPAPAPALAVPVAPPPAPAPAPAPVVSPSPVPAPIVTASDPFFTSSSLIQVSAATTCSLPGMRETLLAEINAVRTAGRVCGSELLPAVAPVTWNDTLFSAAARHSADMAVREYFSHTTPEGISFVQRMYNEGYSARAASENIAAGQGAASGVMASWLNSSGHCRNIMQPVFSEVAVACVTQAGSMYGNYWTMKLGTR